MLQITEPNQNDTTAKNALVVGIDLGTTHSLIAYAKNNAVTIFTNKEGNKLLPSTVLYEKNSEPVVGKLAQTKNTISSIKRLMGRNSEDVKEHVSHELHRMLDHKDITLNIGGRNLTPVEISADIIKHLKIRAEKELGSEIKNAVITIPAYFNHAQRSATKVAAKLAGLNVLRLLSEPTAAALAYGLEKQKQGTYLVYDLGGGTFDISLLKLQNGIFQVIATGGDTWLGGDDIDKAIAEYISEKGGTFTARIHAARQLKEELSNKPKSTITVDNIVYSITIKELSPLVTPLIETTIQSVKDVLLEAETNKVDGIIMVGGSTKMPLIREKLAEVFQTPLITDINPEEVVVRGAALQAAALMGDGDSLLLDVTPLSLGIETAGGLVEKIIPRNTAIPISQAQEFTTFKDSQTAMDIHILQGERETVDTCRSLAKFRLKNIPPMPAGTARITVSYIIDADGLLTVSAQEQTTGISQEIEVNPTYGLKENQILDMLKSSFENASTDVKARSMQETQTELLHLIDACKKALTTDSSLLTKEQSASLYMALEQSEKELSNTNTEELRAIITSLDATFAPFAEKRMNKSLKESFVGLPVSQFE